MILLIDNFDSFSHNLARYFVRLGQVTKVVRNDVISMDEIRDHNPNAIVFSPGPCTPDDSGICVDVVREYAGQIPMLGVCLGHQIIASAFGAIVCRSNEPMHGRSSSIHHSDDELFQGVPSSFQVARYHSLIVDEDSLGTELRATAYSEDGTIMALRHVEHPVFGLQFHPESILSEHGYDLLSNFLLICGLRVTEHVNFDTELSKREPLEIDAWPKRPITF